MEGGRSVQDEVFWGGVGVSGGGGKINEGLPAELSEQSFCDFMILIDVFSSCINSNSSSSYVERGWFSTIKKKLFSRRSFQKSLLAIL